jgi:hypothetical protein
MKKAATVFIVVVLFAFVLGINWSNAHAGEVEWSLYSAQPISDSSDVLDFKAGHGLELAFKTKTKWLLMTALEMNPIEHADIGSLDNLNLFYVGVGKEWGFWKHCNVSMKAGYVKSHDSDMEKTSYSTALRDTYPAKMPPYNRYIPRCIQNKLPPVSVPYTVIDTTKVEFGDGVWVSLQTGFNYNFKDTKWHLGFNPGARYKRLGYEVSNNLRGEIEDDDMEIIDWIVPITLRLTF